MNLDLRIMNKEATGKIREFTDLKAWQEAHQLVLFIYLATKSFPKDEMFVLTSQMRRAAVSITSNIAEGFGRRSYKEKVQFYYLAQGSLSELKSQLLVSRDVHYLPEENFNAIMRQVGSTHRLLQGLLTKSKTFVKNS